MRLSSQAGRVLLRPRPRGETDDWGVRGLSDCGTGTKGGSQGPIGGFLSPTPWAQTTGGVEPGFATRT